MGDPVLKVDFLLAEDADYFGEVGWEGISAGDDGELAAVEMGGLREGDVLGGDADVDNAAADGGIFETLDHGAGVSGGVDDDVAESSFGDFFNLGEVGAIGLRLDGVLNADFFGAEVESVLGEIDDDDFEIHEFEELEGGEADGAGADNHDGFSGLWVAALYGVVADGKGLDEGEFIVGKIVSGMQLVRGDSPVRFTKSS